MKRTQGVALLAGLLFAFGLGLSGMTQPQKVIEFLDVTGAWDPSLALVMLGAIGTHASFVIYARSLEKPVFATMRRRSRSPQRRQSIGGC